MSALPYSYRSVFYLLQNIHYLKTGEFQKTKRELLKALDGLDREVLEMAIQLRNAQEYDFDLAYRLLFGGVRK